VIAESCSCRMRPYEFVPMQRPKALSGSSLPKLLHISAREMLENRAEAGPERTWPRACSTWCFGDHTGRPLRRRPGTCPSPPFAFNNPRYELCLLHEVGDSDARLRPAHHLAARTSSQQPGESSAQLGDSPGSITPTNADAVATMSCFTPRQVNMHSASTVAKDY